MLCRVIITITVIACPFLQGAGLPTVPDGFLVEEYVTGLQNVNALAFSPGGSFGFANELFVADSRPDPGTIYRVPQKGQKIVFAQAIDSTPRSIEIAPVGSAFGPNLFAIHAYSINEYNSSANATWFANVAGFGMHLCFSAGSAFGDRLLYADGGDCAIRSWKPDGTQDVISAASGVYAVRGLALGQGDFGSNLYFVVCTDSFSSGSAVRTITPEGIVADFVASDQFGYTNQLAFDPTGKFHHNLFVSDYGRDAIFEITPQGQVSVFASGLSFSKTPYHIFDGGDIAFGPDGAMYVADGGAGTVWRFAPITGKLTSLEIEGPAEVVEQSSASYQAIAHFDDGTLADVTGSTVWTVKPEIGTEITAGQLSAGKVAGTRTVTISATYSFGQVNQTAQKLVKILAICPSGYALRFDGLDDLAIVPRSLSLEPSEITVELWTKLDGEQLYHARMLRKAAGFANGYCLAANHHMNRTMQAIFPLWNTVGGDIIVGDTQPYSAYFGQWHHFAGVYTSQFVAFYVDGVQVNCIPHSLGSLYHSVSDVIIGNGVESDLEAYKGMIDEVRVWNVARTESQIRQSMNRKLKGTESGLVGYWNFDEGQGQIVHDLSPFANHGFLGSKPQESDAADPVWVLSDAPVGICEDEEPQLENTYQVDAVYGNDDNDGLTRHTAFATIQKAVNVAEEGWTVLVWPGTYHEEVNLKGKPLRIQGQPGAVIDSQGGFGLVFSSSEQADTLVSNFILVNNYAGVFCAGSSPTLRNLTIVQNRNGITAYTSAAPAISNCILWDNTQNDLIGCTAVYSCIQDSTAGQGNISSDPLFADPTGGDYHVKSRIGRYVPTTQQWVQDDLTSPCIDAGDPADDPTGEPLPSGGRIDIGAYGNTPEASKSPNPWPNAADLTHDGRVDLADLAVIAEQWLWKTPWRQ